MSEGRGPDHTYRARRGVAGALARPGVAGLPLSGAANLLPVLPQVVGEWLRPGIADEIENRRLLPWLAVVFGIGILLGFAADGPPSIWPALIAGSACIGFAYRSRAHLGRYVLLVGLAGLSFGFAATILRIASVDAAPLARPLVAKVSGYVEAVEARSNGGGRVTLLVVQMDKLDGAARPRRVRVTMKSLGDLKPGDAVQLSARLLPPPEAARPGGYDFARDAYFRGLSAVGSISGKVTKVALDEPGLSLRLAAGVDRARNALTDRIARSIGGQAGAVAAALVTGKRGLIDETTNDVLRAAGIYHVVSISGLHMVLAAGVFFALTRGLLALSPALALGWPIKKIAAVVGMAAAGAYCVFSGAEVATERSLVMILVMQGSILFDRPAMSMRNLAISALIVLAREPEALLGPSFQMSYGAVAGLITLAEAIRRYRRPTEPGDPIRRIALWLGGLAGGVLATTLIATIATAPFGTYHFQNLQPYGLIGNAVTLPLVSFVVMPAAVFGVLILPFGLDQPIWTMMGWAVAGVLRLSAWVAGFPNSTVVTPAFGAHVLVLLALSLLLATLIGSRLRVLALLPLAGGLAAAAVAPRPDVYAARDGAGAAFRQADGRLLVLGPVPAFTVEQWLRSDGDGRRPSDPTLRNPSRCDKLGCTATLVDGRSVSVVIDKRAFEEDCRRAAIIVSRLPAPPGCTAGTVLDRAHFARHGATTLRLGSSGLVMETVRGPNERRPWLAEPPKHDQRVDKTTGGASRSPSPAVSPDIPEEDGSP